MCLMARKIFLETGSVCRYALVKQPFYHFNINFLLWNIYLFNNIFYIWNQLFLTILLVDDPNIICPSWKNILNNTNFFMINCIHDTPYNFMIIIFTIW